MNWVCGVDGCPGGWVVVGLDLGTCRVFWMRVEWLDQIRWRDRRPAVIAIDIPIGLVDSGARACDLLARRLLGRPRSSSVFTAPIRPVLEASDYRDACRIRRAIDGKKMSKQAYNITPKIAKVDQELISSEALQAVTFEVHPEVSFYHLAGGRSMEHNKKKQAGIQERRNLLEPVYMDAVQRALEAIRELGSGPDDILDAFAALWSAERICKGKAISLPPDPPFDVFGLPMRIVV